MNKKLIILSITTVSLALATTTLVLSPRFEENLTRGDVPYHIVLNDTTDVVEKDEGNLHQITVKKNVIDMIGWSSDGGNFGSIKKETFGPYQYNGMIYNRSYISGFTSLKVDFSGGELRYVLSEFLMENMDFDGELLTSGLAVNVPSGMSYFIIYNTSETPVEIDSVDITYSCDDSVNNTLIFNKNSAMGGARSLAKKTTLFDNFLELENNPTKYTNNYSVGKNEKDTNYTWYRWNGRYFDDSELLGTDFTFGMTVIGNISQMIDESKWFHYAVWPQFGYYDKNGDEFSNEWTYVQTYIGNDNYEPLGKEGALHPTDPYVNEAYTGRFFTDYGWYDNDYIFCNPDTTLIEEGGLTFREAYERYNMPFWFLKFHVFLSSETGLPVCEVSINNMLLVTQEIIDDPDEYDVVEKPSLFITSLPMHLVNYGVDAEGNPGPSYTGAFTYPRLTDN